MSRIYKKLTDAEIRKAQPKAADYKLYDEGNLRLLVRKSGTKVWQLPFKLNSKANIHTIGQYPSVSLLEARQLRDQVKRLISQGLDPNKQKKLAYNANIASSERTVEKIGREWFAKQVYERKYAKYVERCLEKDVYLDIGNLPICDVTPRHIHNVLKKIEDRGALDVAKRTGQRLTAIFDYGIVMEYCDHNPATGRNKAVANWKTNHRPHLKAHQLPAFLQALDACTKTRRKTKLAWLVLLYTFVRPTELCNGRWDEIYFSGEKPIWRISDELMKMEKPHIVPLSKQAICVLTELKTLTGKGKLLFPGSKSFLKPISDGTLSKVLKNLKYDGSDENIPKLVPHGVRATASTILNEFGRFEREAIERQLAHSEKDKVRASYNHAEYLEERTIMMQWWADYLDKARNKKE